MSEYTEDEIIKHMHENAKHENFDIEIKERGKSYDSQHVYYYTKDTKNQIGYGFIGKFENPTKKIALVRCPACRRENYHANVLAGVCSWCPFEANKEDNNS